MDGPIIIKLKHPLRRPGQQQQQQQQNVSKPIVSTKPIVPQNNEIDLSTNKASGKRVIELVSEIEPVSKIELSKGSEKESTKRLKPESEIKLVSEIDPVSKIERSKGPGKQSTKRLKPEASVSKSLELLQPLDATSKLIKRPRKLVLDEPVVQSNESLVQSPQSLQPQSVDCVQSVFNGMDLFGNADHTNHLKNANHSQPGTIPAITSSVVVVASSAIAASAPFVGTASTVVPVSVATTAVAPVLTATVPKPSPNGKQSGNMDQFVQMVVKEMQMAKKRDNQSQAQLAQTQLQISQLQAQMTRMQENLKKMEEEFKNYKSTTTCFAQQTMSNPPITMESLLFDDEFGIPIPNSRF